MSAPPVVTSSASPPAGAASPTVGAASAASAPALPAWAEELKRRYLRGEASLFVLHGNVHDLVLHNGQLIAVSEFLAQTVLEKKTTVARYNVSTGCVFSRKGPAVADLAQELLVPRAADKVLPTLERVLFLHNNVGVILDYAEVIAPAGDASFSSEQDRMVVVTLQRWSLAPRLEASDNIIVLLTETLSDLHPKIVSNPRVAVVRVPMPSTEERRAVIHLVAPDVDEGWTTRLAEVTAGLKTIQIKAILQPEAAAGDDAETRLRFIRTLVADDKRARKLAQVTQGMSREEIRELCGVEKTAAGPAVAEAAELDRVLALIGRFAGSVSVYKTKLCCQ